MERFLIITNSEKDPELKFTSQVMDYIREHGRFSMMAARNEDGHLIPKGVPDDIDCAIVLGGDGTLIRAERELKDLNLPMMGINIGNLGFLTAAEFEDYQQALDILFDGEPEIEERMMLQGELPGGAVFTSMNDIVLSRAGQIRVLPFNVYVNNELLNSYLADGVIVSTPTGSTGYSLSAGGPVVEPTARLFVVTPICSHALNSSSIVLSSKDEIELEVGTSRTGQPEKAYVTFDGADYFRLREGERVKITRATEIARIVRLSKESFLKTVRKKMKGN